MIKRVLVGLLLSLWAASASAQSISSNTSISANGTSANVPLPANPQNYPSIIIAPAPGVTTEIFYTLGQTSAVAAIATPGSTQSSALPSGGICINVGPNTYVAAITSGAAASVRITQLNTCAFFASSSSGSTGSQADPCASQAKTKVVFSTTAGSTQLVGLSGTTRIYVCAVHFVSTAADSISFTEGTGSACATGATAVSGSTTAASGMDFAANTGITEGSGSGTVMSTSVGGDELCLLQSGTTKIAGNLEVVQQ